MIGGNDMKTFTKWSLLVAVIVTLLVPLTAIAQTGAQSPNYFVFKGGIYSPQTNDLDGFDTGFNGEVALGHYLNRNWAVELGAGYFQTSASQTLWLPGGFVARFKADIDVMPITVALKGIIPLNPFELYGIGGLGAYFLWTDARYGGYSKSDSDVIFGGFLGLGANYYINPSFFLGLEGKYLWTDDAKFSSAHIKYSLDGFITTLNIGWRF
jgi:outer membrane protein W